jgi:hypothetical protein
MFPYNNCQARRELLPTCSQCGGVEYPGLLPALGLTRPRLTAHKFWADQREAKHRPRRMPTPDVHQVSRHSVFYTSALYTAQETFKTLTIIKRLKYFRQMLVQIRSKCKMISGSYGGEYEDDNLLGYSAL